MKLLKINKLSWEQINSMLLNIDIGKLTLNSFLSLEKLKPTKTELEIARNYLGDVENLDDASRWVYMVSGI